MTLEYDGAWDEHFRDRPCVPRAGVERDRRAAKLALTHDSVLSG